MRSQSGKMARWPPTAPARGPTTSPGSGRRCGRSRWIRNSQPAPSQKYPIDHRSAPAPPERHLPDPVSRSPPHCHSPGTSAAPTRFPHRHAATAPRGFLLGRFPDAGRGSSRPQTQRNGPHPETFNKADGILEGAEGRFMTRIGHSREAFGRPLFDPAQTVEPSLVLDFDRNPAFSVTSRRFTA